MKYTLFSCRGLRFAIDFLIDNIYVRFGNSVLQQVVGIPIGTNGAPLLADLFLHIYEYDLLYAYNNMIRNRIWRKPSRLVIPLVI